MVRVGALRLGFLFFSFAAGTARAGPVGSIGYAGEVKPLFDAHCVECHHDGGHPPNLSRFPFPSIPADKQDDTVAKILELVGSSPTKMPPGARTKLTPRQVALIQSWLDQGLKP